MTAHESRNFMDARCRSRFIMNSPAGRFVRPGTHEMHASISVLKPSVIPVVQAPVRGLLFLVELSLAQPILTHAAAANHGPRAPTRRRLRLLQPLALGVSFCSA